MSVTTLKRGVPADGVELSSKRLRTAALSQSQASAGVNSGSSSPRDHVSPSIISSRDNQDDESVSSAPTTQPGTPKYPRREKKFICDYPNCGKAYTRPVRLSEHQRTHTNERPFVCDRDNCGKAFLRDSHLKAHVKSHHEDLRDYKCDWPDCEKAFATGQRLREHKKRHEEREQCKCNDCGQSFRRQETLDRHVAAVHSAAGSFECDHVIDAATGTVCGQAFKKFSALKQHRERIHSGLRYFCHECSPEEKESDMAMDESASQLPAVVGFILFSDFQKHMKDVHPPKCLVCGKACETSARLKAHMDIEHQDVEARRTVPCKEASCDRMFTRTGNMLVHYKSAHQNQKFLCVPMPGQQFNTIPDWDGSGACGDGFSTKAALEKHIRTQHLHLPLPNKGKEKRKARKARMVAEQNDAMAVDKSQSEYGQAAAGMLTGMGDDDSKEISCVLAFCPQRFRRWDDLEGHLGDAHGYSGLAAFDAVDAMREKVALSGGQFWLGGDGEDEFDDMELAARLHQALGV
ncbi:Transcription factor IIIA [Sphaceloma murrayae]|uniref:Transcription factor IIIA n=1 Tax=Sphaceloma murrayae TaxID=2082308 RepID=A0A2K1R2F1_9PEZI|nr:Transcription factor IIIA [Sphaceloma murrayae]